MRTLRTLPPARPGSRRSTAARARRSPCSFQPATPGPKSATLSITTSGGTTRTVALTGMGTCPTIAVGGSLPAGTVGTLYGGVVTASGDRRVPLPSRVSVGTLPPGLTLSAAGVISGPPSAAGTFTFTVQAATANGCSGSAPFTITHRSARRLSSRRRRRPCSFGVVPVSTSANQTVTLTNVSASPVDAVDDAVHADRSRCRAVLGRRAGIGVAECGRFDHGDGHASRLSPAACRTARLNGHAGRRRRGHRRPHGNGSRS